MSAFGEGGVPIYVTRKGGGDDEFGFIAAPEWAVLVALLLVWANVVVWGAIGLVTAVKVIL